MKNPHWPNPESRWHIELGLDRVLKLLDRLGNPHKNLPPVVHVAGTNGKGSTIAFLRAMLEAAGYKCHVYTSPHLVDFNERILLAGEQIKDDYLTEILEECRKAAGDIKLTFFEGTTTGAFLSFSRIPADIVLLETGMGGRLDATNVIEKPVLTVITPISLDHTQFLGDTIKQIAHEKAGIIKHDVICVMSEQPPEAAEVIAKTAKDNRARLFRCGNEWKIKERQDGIYYYSINKNLKMPALSLFGDHQYQNAGTAMACVENLQQFNIREEHIIKGLTSAIWPGRLQRLKKGPLVKLLADNMELWIDGGHNESGGGVIARQIKKWREMDGKPVYLIIGMINTKDSKAFLFNFKDITEECCFIVLTSESNSHDTNYLSSIANSLGINNYVSKNLQNAIQKIVTGKKTSCRIIICGSLYLTGTVLAENE